MNSPWPGPTHPTPTHPTPTAPPKPSRSDAWLDDILGPIDSPAAIPGAELGSIAFELALLVEQVGDRDPLLRFRLRMARRRVDELLRPGGEGGNRHPARQALPSQGDARVSSRSATPAGPGQTTSPEVRPTPGYDEVALAGVADGSGGALERSVAGAGAGGVAASPAHSFSLPLRPAVPSFAAGAAEYGVPR